MKSRFKLIAVVVFFMSGELFSQVVMVGPMFHYYFGNGKNNHFAWGVEASLWLITNTVPTGIDLGIEFAPNKTRLYSEAQIGLLVGGSAGYVREFEAGKKSTGGFIGSLWVAAYLGVDVRILQINGQEYVAPGLFYKYMAIPQNININ